MKTPSFASVWDALEDSKEDAEAMKLRSVLMTALREHIVKKQLNQVQAAKHLGVTQPRISDLMRGKIHLFGLEALVTMAAAAGLRIEILVHEAA